MLVPNRLYSHIILKTSIFNLARYCVIVYNISYKTNNTLLAMIGFSAPTLFPYAYLIGTPIPLGYSAKCSNTLMRVKFIFLRSFIY